MSEGAIKALLDSTSGRGDSNSFLYEMIAGLPAAVYITDAQGRITYFNQAAVTLSGRTPVLGEDRWSVTWKLFRSNGTPLPHEECPMALMLKTGEVAAPAEYIAERPDGSRFWFIPHPAVIRDSEGRIAGGMNVLVDITRRKMSEIEAVEQFRAIVDTTPECVKMIAPDGTLLRMNSAGLAIIGAASADEVVGRSVFDLIAPEYRDQYREFHERVCSGERGRLEFEILGAAGRRQVETQAAPLRQPGGSTVHLAITRDITDRKRAEQAALLLGAIVDSSDDAIVSKDLNGIITSWNIGAQRIFGYTSEEVIGKPITILIPTERLDEEPEILRRIRLGERVDHFETIRKCKDGTILDISLTISPVKDKTGKIVGVSKIARDITSRKRTEAAMHASEARFRQLADAMPQIVWTARADGALDYFNERWFQFTGYGHDSADGMAWERILHPEDVLACREAWAQAVKSGQPYNAEYRFWDREGQRWRWFIARALPARDFHGNIVKWFGCWIDIDLQKRVEEELRRANRDLEQFAFSASHDLQEPLRTVGIYSELLARSYSGALDKPALEFLAYIREGAKRMEMLVQDLLTYTHVSHYDPPGQLADTNQALSTALRDLAGTIAETGASVTSDPLPRVWVHETHLQQLFQNLVGNAIKYRSPERPPVVHVTAELQQGDWTLSVADNGIGIERSYKETIFGLFKRLHTKDEYSGTGIGLAICKRIVDRYHGRIWVESEVGKGSTFRFTLPA